MTLALVGTSAIAIGSLSGRKMGSLFENRTKPALWTSRRMALTRACIVSNWMAGFWLLFALSIVSYDNILATVIGVGMALAGSGALLLGRLKTTGALLVAVGSVGAPFFLGRELLSWGIPVFDLIPFFLAFGPAAVTSTVLAASLSKPMYRQLSAGAPHQV